MLLLLVATLIVAAAAVRLAVVAPLRGGLDRVLAAAVAGATQIVVSLLIAGALLRTLTTGAVLLTTAAITVAVFGLTWRMESRVRLRSWRFPASKLRAEARAHPWVTALVVTAALALVWRAFIAYALPPYTYDTLAYHLPTVAGWLQYGHIGTQHLHIYSVSFPANLELLFTWPALLLHSDVWIGTAQIPLAVVGALAVVGIARLAGVSSPTAFAAGALFVLTPIVLSQSSTNYVDLGVAALFLTGIYLILRAFPPAAWGPAGDDSASAARGWSPTYLVFAGCAVGLGVGAKPIGPLLGFVALLCLLAGAIVSRRRLGPSPRRSMAIAALLLLVPMLCLGSYWYVRDLVEFSNPVYPGNVKLLGLTVFHGPGVTLSRLPSGQGLSAIVHSWGYDVTRLFNHSSGRWGRPDEYEGGMGLVWLLLGLPLLIPFVVGAWRRNRMLFWAFLVPLGVLFAIEPYRWWSRFTIFLLAPGLVAIALFVDRSASRRLRLAVQAVAIVCVALGLWLSSSHMVSWGHVYGVGKIVTIAGRPAAQRTVGRLFIPSLRWVDDVAQRARIAEYVRVVITKDAFPPLYGLYGRHFRHRVYALPGTTRAATFAWLEARSIGYVYVRRPSAQDAWFRADGRFRLLFADSRVAAYATPFGRR